MLIVQIILALVAVGAWLFSFALVGWHLVYLVFGPTRKGRPKGGWGQSVDGPYDVGDKLEDLFEKVQGRRRN